MLGSKGHQFLPPLKVPFPPRSDDFCVRSQGLNGQLKPYLVIAFASGPMGNGIGPLLLSYIHQDFANQRPRKGGP